MSGLATMTLLINGTTCMYIILIIYKGHYVIG